VTDRHTDRQTCYEKCLAMGRIVCAARSDSFDVRVLYSFLLLT